MVDIHATMEEVMVESADANQFASTSAESLDKEIIEESKEVEDFGDFADAEKDPAEAILNGGNEETVGEALSGAVVSEDDGDLGEFSGGSESLFDPSDAMDDGSKTKGDTGDLLGIDPFDSQPKQAEANGNVVHEALGPPTEDSAKDSAEKLVTSSENGSEGSVTPAIPQESNDSDTENEACTDVQIASDQNGEPSRAIEENHDPFLETAKSLIPGEAELDSKELCEDPGQKNNGVSCDPFAELDNNEIQANDKVPFLVMETPVAQEEDFGDLRSGDKSQPDTSESIEKQQENSATLPLSMEENGNGEIDIFNGATIDPVEAAAHATAPDSLLPDAVPEISTDNVGCNEESAISIVPSAPTDDVDFGDFGTDSEAAPKSSKPEMEVSEEHGAAFDGEEENLDDFGAFNIFSPDKQEQEEEADKEQGGTTIVSPEMAEEESGSLSSVDKPALESSEPKNADAPGASQEESFDDPVKAELGSSEPTEGTSKKEKSDLTSGLDDKQAAANCVPPATTEENAFGDFGLVTELKKENTIQGGAEIDAFSPVSDKESFGDFDTSGVPPAEEKSEKESAEYGSSTQMPDDNDRGSFESSSTSSAVVPENSKCVEYNPNVEGDSTTPPVTKVEEGFGDFGSFEEPRESTSSSNDTPGNVHAASSEVLPMTGSGAADVEEDDDFGDFGDFEASAPPAGIAKNELEAAEEKIARPDGADKVDENDSDDGFGDFGDFEAPAAPSDTANNEREVFEESTVKSGAQDKVEDEDFGDFGDFEAPAAPSEAANNEHGVANESTVKFDAADKVADEDDDFGDFGDFEASAAPTETDTKERAEERTGGTSDPIDELKVSSGNALLEKAKMVFAGVFSSYGGDETAVDEDPKEQTDKHVSVESILVSIE